MFVHSLFKEEIVYRVRGKKYIIKPGMNNLTGVTKEELVRTFGNIDLVFVEGNKVEAPVEEDEQKVVIPEQCAPCYANDKTPSDVDCAECKAKEADADGEEEMPTEVIADSVEEVKTEIAEVEANTPAVDAVQEANAPVADVVQEEATPDKEEGEEAPKTEEAVKAPAKSARKATGKKANK